MSPIRFYIWPRYVLKANGKRVRFTRASKFALALALLVKANGGVVSHEELIEAAYFGDPEGGPLCANGCMKVAMHKMRKILAKIDLDLMNVFGRGYKLVNRH